MDEVVRDKNGPLGSRRRRKHRERILLYVATYVDVKQVSPRHAEISAELGIAKSSVSLEVAELVRQGLLSNSGRRSGGLRITKDGTRFLVELAKKAG